MKAFVKDMIEIIRDWAIGLFVLYVIYKLLQADFFIGMLVLMIIVIANPKYFKN